MPPDIAHSDPIFTIAAGGFRLMTLATNHCVMKRLR
jgi:hypothetical protein